MSYVSPLTAFARTVEPKTYELHELARGSSIFNVTHFFHYENVDGTADFMPTSLLEEAFVDLLCEFPLMAGALHTPLRGLFTVVVEPSNLNLPEFKVSHCEADFAELKAANYAPSLLPADAATAGRYVGPTQGGPRKLAYVHIMRCKGNSGVVMFVAIAHVLLDGSSFNQVMRRWAELCKHRAAGGAPDAKPGRAIDFDYTTLSEHIQRGAPPAGAFIRHQFAPGGLQSRVFVRLPLTTQVTMARLMCGGAGFGSHFYRISQETIDALLQVIHKVVPAYQRVSANDAVSALVNIAMAQCLNDTAAGDPPTGAFQRAMQSLLRLLKPQPKMFEHIGVADVRTRIGMGPEAPYCGDAVVHYTSLIPLAEMQGEVTPTMLAQVAMATRKGTESIDRAYVHAMASTILAEPDCTVRPFAYGIGPPSHLVITNHSRIGHYQVDFGWGAPVWTNVLEESMTAMCYLYSAPPPTTGNIIHLLLPHDIHKRVHHLQFWKDHTEFIR
ncbi:hypothetical protein H4R19_000713 [Coemansia spiralis]|nr:hypothetical protein H4R19_000713 [Coemansia spiralis]